MAEVDSEHDVTISRMESFWLWMLRRTAASPVQQTFLKWKVGRLEASFSWRSKNNLWGRFGGGWNWNLGFQAGGSTVIFNLLVASLGLTYCKPKQEPADA